MADLGLLQHLKWSFFVTVVNDYKPLAIVANRSSIYVAVLETAADSLLCLPSVTNATRYFSYKLAPYFIQILDSESNFSVVEANKNLRFF